MQERMARRREKLEACIIWIGGGGKEDDVLTHTIQIYNLRGGRRERKMAPAQSDVNEEDEEERSMRTTQASAPVEAGARARTRGSMREHTHL